MSPRTPPDRAEFPNCATCVYARTHRAEVCLPCIRTNTMQPSEDSCAICSQNLAPSGACPNDLCRQPDRQIDSVRVVAMYQGEMYSKMHRLKGIEGQPESPGWGHGPFGAAMAGVIAEMHPPPGEPLVVANPPNPSKDYDAVRWLLQGIAAAATFPACQHLDVEASPTVIRTRDVPSLRGTPMRRRRYIATNELRSSLRVTRPQRVSGRAVVLVDDLFVSGSTVDEVARALKSEGAARVDVVAIARKVWWPR